MAAGKQEKAAGKEERTEQPKHRGRSLSNKTREREKKELEHEAQSKALVSKGLDTLTIIFVVLFLSICMFYPVKVTRTSKKTFESTYFLFQHQ